MFTERKAQKQAGRKSKAEIRVDLLCSNKCVDVYAVERQYLSSPQYGYMNMNVLHR